MPKVFLIKKLDERAKIPQMHSGGAAGYDLHALTPVTIPSGSRIVVRTGIAIEMPEGFFGRICSRSSMSLVHGIEVGAGIIDEDYRGEIFMLLYNHGKEDYDICEGERMAQLVLQPRISFPVVQATVLTETERNSGGFGSTGKL